MDRLDRPGAAARTIGVGVAGQPGRPAHDLGRIRPRGGPNHRLERDCLPAAATRAATATGRRRWMQRSRKNRNRNRSAAIRDPGRRDAEVRDGVLLDSREQREREGEGADQHGQQDVQHAVAVPEPEVAGREGARRHLHDEDADRDDEARERGRRADDRREQVVAVDAEYSRCSVTPIWRWSGASIRPRIAPAMPPSSGRNQRLPFRYWRVLKRSAHTLHYLSAGRPGTHHPFRVNDPKRSSRRDDVGRRPSLGSIATLGGGAVTEGTGTIAPAVPGIGA